MAEEKETAQRLKDLRRKMGLSQRQMAESFYVAPGSISLWESGRRGIPGPVEKLIEIYEKNELLKEQEFITSLYQGRWERLWMGTKFLGKSSLNWLKANLSSKLVARDKSLEIKRQAGEAIYMEFFQLMSEYKGLHLKIAQMFAFMKKDLPEPVKAFVEKYQYQVKAIDPQIVDQIFVEEFGKKPEELFQEWHKLPFAAGSIGQVHYAKTKEGKELAVKVQYPDIVKALKSDLSNLESLTKYFSFIFKFNNKDDFLDELKQRFLEECDYVREKENMQTFSEFWKDDPVIRIPQVEEEFCGQRILAMEYIEGKDFNAFIKKASVQEKSHFSQNIFRFSFQSIYQLRYFNADPHPGNYLIKGDQIYILDYGCVCRYTEEDTRLLKKLFIAGIENDFEEFSQASRDIGFVGDYERFDYHEHYKMIRLLLEPVLAEDNTYRFNHHYIKEIYRLSFSDNPNLRYTRVYKPYVFLQRFQFGLYVIFADLEEACEWRSTYLKIIGLPADKPITHSLITEEL